MKKIIFLTCIILLSIPLLGQDKPKTNQKGHYNLSPFKQLKEELATPNSEHTASGAPGHNYTQQQVDYDMNITLDDDNKRIFGESIVTYHNNSKDVLDYLWIQLDQNMHHPKSLSKEIGSQRVYKLYSPKTFTKMFIKNPFEGGFCIDYVKDNIGNDLPYFINWTMMRVNLKKPLAPGEKFVFKIKWWYNINNYAINYGRSGYKPSSNNTSLYIIAQFFPRLAVYNNVEGWQNMQFWGRSEFALEFGNYNVSITLPENFTLQATGELQNPKEVFTKKQYKRYLDSRKWFDKPRYIVTQEDARNNEKTKTKETKTWKFYAENVRDFAFSASQKFMWDAQAVDINEKTVMAYSLYPEEVNPLWQDVSTKVIATTLKRYSKFAFDYPYPHATSVNAKWQGMEYPMISWNDARIKKKGTYSERTKRALASVITHEVGHNFFPMIVNSDERQWTWMDEGINTFVQIYAMNDFDKKLFPLSTYPKNIVPYMRGDQSYISPIMTQGDDVFQFGSNAYHKPAAGLFILRETIMGHELFDYAFRTYSLRWRFKHPTPADFFRTMEDASAIDLDWFWRGWFYTTQTNDFALNSVEKYTVDTDKDGKNITLVKDAETSKKDIKAIQDYIKKTFGQEAITKLKVPNYIYKIKVERKGELPMPLIIELTLKNGEKIRKQFPAETWRHNRKIVTKLIPTMDVVEQVIIDPENQTADINMDDNYFPKKETDRFEKFKKKKK